MSSINTSNSIGISSLMQQGKRPTNPEDVLRSINDSQDRTQSGGSTGDVGKTASTGGEVLRSITEESQAVINDTGMKQADPRVTTAHRTAEQLIATTLIKPILAQVRASNNAAPPFGQTQAEKQFGALLDNRLADDIAKASNFPITQRIAEQILKNSPVIPESQLIDPAFTHTPVDIFG